MRMVTHRIKRPVKGYLRLYEAAEAIIGAEEREQVSRVPDLLRKPAVVGGQDAVFACSLTIR